jgi:uncharacterized repeat protein (TIGR01451 family)
MLICSAHSQEAAKKVDVNRVGTVRVLVVLDTSGSMVGEKLQSTLEAINALVRALPDDARAGIITFSTEASAFSESLVTCDASGKKQLEEYIAEEIYARGGTNYEDALEQSEAILKKEKGPATVVFVTDGKPTIGETDAGKLFVMAGRLRDAGHGLRFVSLNDKPTKFLKILNGIGSEGPLGVLFDVKASGPSLKNVLFQASGLPVKQEALSWKGPRLTFLHKSFKYTMTVRNTGKDPADRELTCTLPANVDYIASMPPGTLVRAAKGREAAVTWRLTDIAGGRETEVELTLRAKATGRSQIAFGLADLSGSMKIEKAANLLIIGVPATHVSSYDTEDPVEVGKQTMYVVDVRNEGTSPCTNVLLESAIPENMEFVSATGPGPHKFEAGTVRFEPVPIMQPGDKVTYKIVCKATKAGCAVHSATVKFDQFIRAIRVEEGTSIY